MRYITPTYELCSDITSTTTESDFQAPLSLQRYTTAACMVHMRQAVRRMAAAKCGPCQHGSRGDGAVKRATTLDKVLAIIADESVKNRHNLKIERRLAETNRRRVQVEKHAPRLSRIPFQVFVQTNGGYSRCHRQSANVTTLFGSRPLLSHVRRRLALWVFVLANKTRVWQKEEGKQIDD